MRNLKHWFNGYGDSKLLNPWSVVSYLVDLIRYCEKQTICDFKLEPKEYWNRSGDDMALYKIS